MIPLANTVEKECKANLVHVFILHHPAVYFFPPPPQEEVLKLSAFLLLWKKQHRTYLRRIWRELFCSLSLSLSLHLVATLASTSFDHVSADVSG